jgi:hypothetical protein
MEQATAARRFSKAAETDQESSDVGRTRPVGSGLLTRLEPDPSHEIAQEVPIAPPRSGLDRLEQPVWPLEDSGDGIFAL